MSAWQFLVYPQTLPQQYLEWYRLKMAFQHDLGFDVNLHVAQHEQDYLEQLTRQQPAFVFGSMPIDLQAIPYKILAKPVAYSNDIVWLSRVDSDITSLAGLRKNATIAAMSVTTLRQLAQLMLASVDIEQGSLLWREVAYVQAVLRMLHDGEAEVGVMPCALFDGLQPALQQRYRMLARSHFDACYPVFMLREDQEALTAPLRDILLNARRQMRYYPILRELGLQKGLALMDDSECCRLKQAMRLMVQ